MSPTPPLALVPVRDPGRGKSRLAGVLGVEARAALTGAMLADVVTALHGAGMQRIVVLAGGSVAASAATALGVDVLLDPPGEHGLNAALATAARRIRAHASLVVPADLPLLTPDDVTELVGTAGEVVVAATQDGGTGGLLRRPAAGVPHGTSWRHDRRASPPSGPTSRGSPSTWTSPTTSSASQGTRRSVTSPRTCCATSAPPAPPDTACRGLGPNLPSAHLVPT